MRDAAGGRDHLDVVLLLEPLQAVPQPDTAAEHDRNDHDVEVVDGWSLGRVCAAARDRAVLKAAANPRFMQNYATGR